MIALHRYKNNRSSFLIAAHWYFMIFCVFATFKIGFHKSSSRLLFCHGYFSHIDHHSVRNIYWLVLVESHHMLLLDMKKLNKKLNNRVLSVENLFSLSYLRWLHFFVNVICFREFQASKNNDWRNQQSEYFWSNFLCKNKDIALWF